MNNAATALMRIAVLAGGAAMGALLARWVDDIVSTQSQQKSDYDKARYSQGLSPFPRNRLKIHPTFIQSVPLEVRKKYEINDDC